MSSSIAEAISSSQSATINSKTRIARGHAVAAALETIAAFAASGNTSVDLEKEFSKLSAYADKIQEALKVK
jgi:acyl-coenzyme A thioesterase PaaI-like protein|nr:hypothetical protein [uncultured Pseudomonas sp.]